MFRPFAVLIAISISLSAPVAKAADPVRIGFSRPVTGAFSRISVPQFNAYELWRDEVNKTGGLDVGGKERRRVVLISRDDHSNPDLAAQIYEDLIVHEKVDLLFPPWGEALHMAVAGVTERYAFPMLAATIPTEFYDQLAPTNIWFPSPASPMRLAEAVAEYLASRSVSNAALIIVDTPFCQEASQALLPPLAKAGIRLAVEETITRGADVAETIPKVREANPEAVLFYGYPGDTVLYLKAARAMDYRPRTEFALSGVQYNQVVVDAGGRAEGLISPGQWIADKSGPALANEFQRRYLEKFGTSPDHFLAPLAYVGAEILQQVVAKAGLDKAAQRKALSSETFETINGPIRFKAHRNAVTAPLLLQVRGGELQAVWPPEKAAD